MDGLDYNPAAASPLFSAQYITCAYPISDLYASTPRYLYYALLVATFVFQWHPWLANVFLGAAATYAGTAAIEAFILISHRTRQPVPQNITIPYIPSTSVSGNASLEALHNLITDSHTVGITPAALELDIDAILAIVITAYLLILPIHCFSSTIREHRAYHLLMCIWNALMLGGSICVLILWPDLYGTPYQARFCYPLLPDPDSVTSNGAQLPGNTWQGDWNSTIWHTFSDIDAWLQNDNCLYPCFNTSQIMRRPSTLTASVTASQRSPHTSPPGTVTSALSIHMDTLLGLIYASICALAVVAFTLLALNLTGLHRLTRVPIYQPKLLLKKSYSLELLQEWIQEIKHFNHHVVTLATTHPAETFRRSRQSAVRKVMVKIRHFLRFMLDMIALIILLVAMVFTPAIILFFVLWIEWYIHRDMASQEAPSQVGQWTSPVSIGLVLASALVLKTKNWMASEREVERDITRSRLELTKLEELLTKKREQQSGHRRVKMRITTFGTRGTREGAKSEAETHDSEMGTYAEP